MDALPRGFPSAGNHATLTPNDMADQNKYPNSGTLSRNTRKQAGTKQPDADGRASITCPHCNTQTEWVIAGWLRDGPKGRFSSLAFKTKEQADKERAARQMNRGAQ